MSLFKRCCINISLVRPWFRPAAYDAQPVLRSPIVVISSVAAKHSTSSHSQIFFSDFTIFFSPWLCKYFLSQ